MTTQAFFIAFQIFHGVNISECKHNKIENQNRSMVQRCLNLGGQFKNFLFDYYSMIKKGILEHQVAKYIDGNERKQK